MDPLGNQELWFNKLNRAIGGLQYDFDVLNSTRLKNMELILTQINNQIDGEALVSDADLAAHEAHVIAQINANEAKIDALEAKADSLEGKLDTLTVAVSALEEKLDDEASFTDDSELATHEANVLAAIDGAESSLAMAIAGVESKLDDEASFTDDTELAAAQSAIIAEVDANETKIDALATAVATVEGKLDSLDSAVGALETKLDSWILTAEGKLDTLDSVVGALESKLDGWITTATGRFDALDEAAFSLETKLDDPDFGLAAIKTAVDMVEAKLDDWIPTAEAKLDSLETKLDDETRFTDDSELATHEANVLAAIDDAKDDVITEVNANETKIDALATDVATVEGKLDDETRFTDDSELATHEANVLAAINNAESSLAMAIAGVESKLDDEANFTDDTELAAAQSAIISEVDANETKIDAVDNALSQIESKLDGANGLAAIKTDTGNIWGAVNNATYGLSSIKDDTGNIWSTINLADNFGGHTLAEILNAIATLQTDVTQIKNQLNDIYNGTQCVEVCP